MKKLLSTALAGVFAAVTLIPAVPAIAQDRDGMRGDWCKFGNCRDRDGGDRFSKRDRDWDRDGPRYSFNRHWDDDWRWRRHRHRDRFDDHDAAGLVFGLAAGALAAGVAASTYPAYPGSYERCAATYRTFDPATWTYRGYDGLIHRCPY